MKEVNIDNINKNKNVSAIIKVQPKKKPGVGNNAWNLVVAQNLVQAVLGKDIQLTSETSIALVDKQIDVGAVEKLMAAALFLKSGQLDKLTKQEKFWSGLQKTFGGIVVALTLITIFCPPLGLILSPILAASLGISIIATGICKIMQGHYQVELAKNKMELADLNANIGQLQSGNNYMNSASNNSIKKLSGSMKTRKDLRGQEFNIIRQMGQSESNISRKVS